jgi:hypothetical protein
MPNHPVRVEVGELAAELARANRALAHAEAAVMATHTTTGRLPHDLEMQLELGTARMTEAGASWPLHFVSYQSPLQLVIEASVLAGEGVLFAAAVAEAIRRLWNTPLKIRRDRAQLEAETAKFLRERVEESLRLRELELEAARAGPEPEQQVVALPRGLVLVSAELGEIADLVQLAREEQQRSQQLPPAAG